MSLRAADAHRPRTRNGFVLFWVALFVMSVVLQSFVAATPQRALATHVDPVLTEGNPDCQDLGFANDGVKIDPPSEGTFDVGDGSVTIDITGDGEFTWTSQGVTVLAVIVKGGPNANVYFYNPPPTTTDSGLHAPQGFSHIDICWENPPETGDLRITKDVEGGPANFTGNFDITVDCGASGTFHETIHFPDPGFVVIEDIDAEAECEVTEVDAPNAPDGFEWDDPTFTGNPATIESNGTVTVGITNHLDEVAAPALTVDKGVSLSADGPFTASLNTTVGTTVHYRITITNTGNVELTGVTLTDNTFDLEAEGCDVPATLAVGAHFDCNYDAVATLGTTTNIATGDSNQTGPDTGTATVVATAATGSLEITKVIPNVPADFEGTFAIRITCTGADPINTTIEFPDPGSVTVNNLPAGASCLVLETDRGTPPAGFDWAGPVLFGPVTIEAGETAEITVTNLLTELQAGEVLTIEKSNNAPGPAAGGAEEGDTVTYTLAYTLDGPVTNGTIEDVLPVGVTYVDGSAEAGDNADMVFESYDSATRTLTWLLDDEATASGSVTYQVTIDEDAAEIGVLTNQACISSDETDEDCDTSDVFVAPPVLAETAPPPGGGDTAPPTDVAVHGTTGTPGISLPLLLIALAGLAFALVMVTPMPASMRGRNRRG